jgi:hypothetical protein
MEISMRNLTALAGATTIVGFGLLMVNRDGSFFTHPTEASRHDAHHAQQYELTIMLERSFEVQRGGHLVMEVPDGNVAVETSATGQASVTVLAGARDPQWARSVFERMRFDVQSADNQITVEATDPHIERSEWQQHRGVHVEVRVTVPTEFDVRIHTGDGDVSADDLVGDVEIRSGDGDLVLGHLRGERITLRTGDGDVEAEELEAPEISLHTGDGDMRVRSVHGSLEASSGDGDIAVHLATPAATTIRTGDGDIAISMAEAFGLTLDLRGEDLVIPRGLEFDGVRRSRSVRGDLLGGGPRLVATTSDGTVMLQVRR